ncbi:hypothetical protein MTR_8g015060 [Medicago truncatula]|uniref:Uncharacterized protein n=1 Tax=Medicago truncatula TaxID=3880 RepID=A0A072TL51_MEDTR|nr:hypothetical protein MTR_8g015060 [Medicago truncatula]
MVLAFRYGDGDEKWFWHSDTVMMMNDGVDDEIEDSSGDDDERRNFRVRGWCPSPRQGRPLDSKSTYNGNDIYLPPKALAGLEPGFSRIQNLSFYH